MRSRSRKVVSAEQDLLAELEQEQVQVQQVDDLIELVDKYGKVCEELKKLQEVKEALRHKILVSGKDYIRGREYEVSVTEKKEAVVSPVKALKKLGSRNFLQVVSVSITSLRKFLPQPEIEEIIDEYKVVRQVSVRKIQK